MATLKDVAKESGLAVATVSRVLNNRGYISEETRANVYAAMERLNYQPNEIARSLSKQSTNIIGVIVPHLEHPYYAKLISCLEQAAYIHGYRLLVFNSKYREEKEEEYLELCKSNRVAGIVLCSGTINSGKLRETEVPLITLERGREEGVAAIECDNRQGGVLAATCLLEAGCRHILCFGKVSGMEMPADIRANAFAKVCEAKGMGYHVLEMEKERYFSIDYKEAIEEALEAYPQTDGIFTGSDVIAAQVIQVCVKKGIEIPKDMKLVGFDDVNLASLTCPAITTIRQPFEQMAEAAICCIHNVREKQKVPKLTVLPVKLIQRETT